jgi:4-amino-4-deoxy-L-arabinose transferase-like glycosyltransferase
MTGADGWHRLPRRLAFWRSPADQPAWARPVLLGLAVASGLLAGWRMGSSIEIFYAAAVRSMSTNWHNFVYAAFDPSGTISVDKLPGGLWAQALSVRLFGVHDWAVDLPQVVEGVLAVLVVYRPVRRLAGPGAGIAAAGILALSPSTVGLDRGNISDSLLILLLVLAADALVGALLTDGIAGVLVAGVWLGLAFQAKMIEAWLLLPALCLTYLVAAPTLLVKRITRVVVMVATVAVVSLSWMTFVTLTPSGERPAVDGSQHNSVFEQVFGYNGFGRVGQPSPNAQLGRTLDIPALRVPSPPPAWNRLLLGAYGRDIAWLLPAALVVLVAGLVARRKQPRTDPLRAGLLLWGAWLVTLGAVFSVSATINNYYLAALAPPLAALLGIGAALAWAGRSSLSTRVLALATVAGTSAYAVWLLPASGTGLPGWLAPAVAALGAVAVVLLVATAVVRGRPAMGVAAAITVCIALLVVPTVATVSIVAETLGPFDTPFQPLAVTAFTRAFFGAPLQTVSTLPRIQAARNGAPDLMATQTSVLAAPFIYATGQEVLPVGGYTGTNPAPTLGQLRRMVGDGRFHLVLAARGSTDSRILWIARHCASLPPDPGAAGAGVIGPIALYFCLPGDAG